MLLQWKSHSSDSESGKKTRKGFGMATIRETVNGRAQQGVPSISCILTHPQTPLPALKTPVLHRWVSGDESDTAALSVQTHSPKNNMLSPVLWCTRTSRIASPVWKCSWSSGNSGKNRQFPNLKKGLRSLLRGFAFGKFCQVTQADAILGIFLLRFSKPFFSNIPEVTLLKMETDGPLYKILGESQGFLRLGSCWALWHPHLHVQEGCCKAESSWGISYFFSIAVI